MGNSHLLSVAGNDHGALGSVSPACGAQVSVKVFGGLHPTPGIGIPITKLTPNRCGLGTLVAPVALVHPCPSSRAAVEVTSASSQNGLWWKTNPLLLLPYLCGTREFHCRAVCFINWNIFLLFKHIPWHFPALMSASLQLSRFLSLLIFYLTSQTTKQPSTLGASLRSLCSHKQPSELSSRLQQTAWEQGFGMQPRSQSLAPEHRAGARSSRSSAVFPSLSMCLGTFWEAR